MGNAEVMLTVADHRKSICEFVDVAAGKVVAEAVTLTSKGWFRTSDGERIDPLTISEAHSRYLLRCQAVETTDMPRVPAVFEAAFREYGLPRAIRTDNGAPFASPVVVGLSRLAVWWIDLGIVPERIAAGHPEQPGRHERMHRTLKQEAAQPPAANRREQQRALDRFARNIIRCVRRRRWRCARQRKSISDHRAFPARIPELEYPASMLVRSVRHQGNIRWKKHDLFLTEVLWGERVGLLPEGDRWFTIYFAQYSIARFDSKQLRAMPLSMIKEENKSGAPKTNSFKHPGDTKSAGDVPGLRCQESARPFSLRPSYHSLTLPLPHQYCRDEENRSNACTLYSCTLYCAVRLTHDR